jgi:hypothetical protein
MITLNELNGLKEMKHSQAFIRAARLKTMKEK